MHNCILLSNCYAQVVFSVGLRLLFLPICRRHPPRHPSGTPVAVSAIAGAAADNASIVAINEIFLIIVLKRNRTMNFTILCSIG